MVYARLMLKESRLAAARASEDHAVREVLEVGAFDEEDLYEALEYLEQRQVQIETALARPQSSRGPGAVFLYDVTSVYFEGQHNQLAEFGYNRDGKKGKKQMVAGLLTENTSNIEKEWYPTTKSGMAFGQRPRKRMAAPLSATAPPAAACIHRSNFATGSWFSPYRPRNTMVSMVAMVTAENTKATSTIPCKLCRAAGYMSTGIRGSQGPKTKTIKRIQGVRFIL